jgi:hypothetical protein
MKWKLLDTADVTYQFNAYEANNTRGAGDKVVRLTFAGYGAAGDPTFVFQYTPPAEEERDPAA